MAIDEDPFPLVASINTVSFDLRALIESKKAGRFLPSVRVRKVWIPKQYLTYKNDLVAKGRVPTAKKWKKHEETCFSKGKEHDPSRRKIPQRFIILPTISPVQE